MFNFYKKMVLTRPLPAVREIVDLVDFSVIASMNVIIALA